MTVAFRVQAADGRGPWRPGFTRTWLDADAPADRHAESLFDIVAPGVLRALPHDMVCGCACRTYDALMAWFTPIERDRLARAGYHPVRLNADRVLAESAWQMLIARRRPFTDGASRLKWPAR